MIGRQTRILGVGSLLLMGLALAACAPAAADVSASGAWVRAATVDAAGDTAMSGASTAMDMPSSTPSMGMESDETGMDAESDTEMEMDSASGSDTNGMSMSSGSGGVSAAYMTLTNQGGATDKLVSATTDVAGIVEIHTSEVDSAGVMHMRPLTDGLEIPANGSVSLEPGGYHIMLMELKQNLVAGETVTLTLTFESGKTLTVEAEVRSPQ